MRIAIVGSTHPYKGGIAQHTTQLAHHLKDAGNEVEIISWKRQYPFFYPGVQFVPENKPEMPVFGKTTRALSWNNPAGWIRWARKMKTYDKVIFVWWVPTIQGPVYLSMLKALGKKGPETIILCHNVVSHGAGPADKQLTKQVFKLANRILVHTEALAGLARSITKTPVEVAAMPAHLPGNSDASQHPKHLQNNLLFFGLVRKYKGLDILLQALAKVPEIKLTIAGEMWGKQQENLELQIAELKLKSRVTLIPGYVPAENINGLFNAADAMVLPYRSGTASQNSALAFAHGVPVIATNVGSMPDQIKHGVDGLLCQPEDVEGLATVIKYFYQPGVAAALTANLPQSTAEQDWQTYVATLVK